MSTELPSLDERYWTERYEAGQTGWDIGYPSTPLKEYIDQLEDKSLRILIPGAGNAYEAAYLWEQGFRNVHVLDLSQAPLDQLKERVSEFPAEQLHHLNFFETDPERLGGEFDLILEQTFFCALHPKLRTEYVKQMKNLLKPSGKLVGVLFNIPLFQDHPPFGGNSEEYLELFKPLFELKHYAACHNSILPRSGNEWFICLVNQ